MKKASYNSAVTACNLLKKFPDPARILSASGTMLNKYYADIDAEIKKLRAISKDIEIGDYDEWTNGDALVYAYDKYITKSQEKINRHKELYIKALSSALKKLEAEYDVPAVMIAGVAYIEFGGDPPIADYVAIVSRHLQPFLPEYIIRGLTQLNVIKSRPPSHTSFGNISMQLRRAAETLGYYKKLDMVLETKMIHLLEDDRTALALVARHLQDLKNIDFPQKRATELTLEEMSIVVGRYNQGPNQSIGVVRNSGYAERFINMYDQLRSWIE